jgi:HK97 family phage prohead protease
MEIERRYLVAELRIAGDESDPVIEGYAAVYNKLSEDLGGFREKIKPGAFRKSLKRSDTVMLFNHDPNYPLGRVSAGTLELKEDSRGLLVRAKPPRSAGRIIESIQRGDVTKMSFGFTTERDSWVHKKDESIRTLEEVGELPDVGPVVFPAYPDTQVAIRSLERSKATAKSAHSRDKADDSGGTHSRSTDMTDSEYWRSKKEKTQC